MSNISSNSLLSLSSWWLLPISKKLKVCDIKCSWMNCPPNTSMRSQMFQENICSYALKTSSTTVPLLPSNLYHGASLKPALEIYIDLNLSCLYNDLMPLPWCSGLYHDVMVSTKMSTKIQKGVFAPDFKCLFRFGNLYPAKHIATPFLKLAN